MSRRSEIQKIEAERLANYKPPSVEDKVMELYAQDLYHYNGIAKLTNLSYRRVREIIRDHIGRAEKQDTE